MSQNNQIKYRVKFKDQRFYVVEKTTDYFIKEFFNKIHAEKYCKKLNNGAAFDGFTPQFMLKSTR